MEPFNGFCEEQFFHGIYSFTISLIVISTYDLSVYGYTMHSGKCISSSKADFATVLSKLHFGCAETIFIPFTFWFCAFIFVISFKWCFIIRCQWRDKESFIRKGNIVWNMKMQLLHCQLKKSKRKIKCILIQNFPCSQSLYKKLKFSALQKCIKENVRRTIDGFNPGKYLHISNYEINMLTYIF